MIGSIGVISSGFGAHELMVRQDVERRIHTAGKSKSMLDPFSPEKPEDVERLKDLLEDIHTNFIDHVTARRGDKLDKDTELFTGQVWLAKKALALMLKERFGDKVQLRSYGARRPLLARFGAQVVSDTIRSVEERAAYAQFGL
jgi:ClpP class serine protease